LVDFSIGRLVRIAPREMHDWAPVERKQTQEGTLINTGEKVTRIMALQNAYV
jgi:hypothetical protein